MLQLLSKMDLILAKLAAKSTGSTDPFYPMMLRPGTVFVPPSSDADTKSDFDNTVTSSPEADNMNLPVDNVSHNEVTTNENHGVIGHRVAIVNGDIEVQAIESCQSDDVKVEITSDVIADDVMPIETISNDVTSETVISNDVTEIQVEAVKMEYDDAIGQPSTSTALIQSEASKLDDQTETFFIGSNESGKDSSLHN